MGKIENCQVGVFAAYASPQGYSLLDKQSLIPETWFADPYKDRRWKYGLPATTIFKTKVELAVEMLEMICEEKTVPFRYLVAETAYGRTSTSSVPFKSIRDGSIFLPSPPKPSAG